MNLDDFSQLKKRIDRLQREADKAAGAAEQVLETLRKEFEVNGIEEAKKLLEVLSQQEQQAEQKYQQQLVRFEESWTVRLRESA